LSQNSTRRAWTADYEKRCGSLAPWADPSAERFGCDIHASDLDLQRTDLILDDHLSQSLDVQWRDILDLEGSEKRG
jgi:hypothetical protein